MARTTHYTSKDGNVAKRTSKTKHYTHVMVCLSPANVESVWSWHSSERLAEAASRTMTNTWNRNDPEAAKGHTFYARPTDEERAAQERPQAVVEVDGTAVAYTRKVDLS